MARFGGTQPQRPTPLYTLLILFKAKRILEFKICLLSDKMYIAVTICLREKTDIQTDRYGMREFVCVCV